MAQVSAKIVQYTQVLYYITQVMLAAAYILLQKAGSDIYCMYGHT
jgi:hypothetical protein